MKTRSGSMLGVILVVILFAPHLAGAQEAPESESPTATAKLEMPSFDRLDDLERENQGLKTELSDLKLQVEDVKADKTGFNYKSAALTFFLTTGLVATSYFAADQLYGDSTRMLMPGLTTTKVVGFGALAAAGPAFVAGIGSGLDSPSAVSAGITVDVLLALAPWGVGISTHKVATSKYGDKLAP
jgi:hypothetical protein